MSTYKTLTVRQPWAQALIHGNKRIENRSRPMHYRGPLLIHAGKCDPRDHELELPDGTTANRLDLTFGAVIGIVDVVDCVAMTDPKVTDDPYASGPHCIITTNPRALATPIPAMGKIGLWPIDLPDDVAFTPTERSAFCKRVDRELARIIAAK